VGAVGAAATPARIRRGATILNLTAGHGRPLHVLAIGAHCDDIEIGAGGSLLQWASEGHLARVDVMVCSSTPDRAEEAREAAHAFLDAVPQVQVAVHAFRDGFLPHEGPALKETFEALKATLAEGASPDVILTHWRDDRHQDHRLVSDLTWNTFRDHLVLEYEIPKYDGDLGQPNAFVAVSDEHVARKWELLRRHYGSQADRYWFTEDTFRGLMRIRGVEARSATGFAEAFTMRKAPLALDSGAAARTEAARDSVGALRWGTT